MISPSKNLGHWFSVAFPWFHTCCHNSVLQEFSVARVTPPCPLGFSACTFPVLTVLCVLSL